MEEIEEVLEPSTKKSKMDAAHYVDNKKFLAALIDYRKDIDTANIAGIESPSKS